MGEHGAKSQGILVVDDDDALRSMITEHLRDLGYTVWEAADPVAALDIVGIAAHDVDLVVTDLVMPKMSRPALRRAAARAAAEGADPAHLGIPAPPPSAPVRRRAVPAEALHA